ncbi:MAG: tetratricopeptide repeat protein [Paracoccaceae bacterium]
MNHFVDKVAALGGDDTDGLAEAVAAAEEMLAEGAASDAAQTFAAILEEDPENAASYGGLVRAHIALGDLDQAEAVLNGAPAAIASRPELEAAHAQLELARAAANAGPVDELSAQVAADPANHQARFDLAQALHATGDVQGAVDQLLDLFKRDRGLERRHRQGPASDHFRGAAARSVALSGRRKLASMILV